MSEVSLSFAVSMFSTGIMSSSNPESIHHNHVLMQAGDLQKACAIARQDPGSDLAPTPADFQERVQSLAAQLLQVCLQAAC